MKTSEAKSDTSVSQKTAPFFSKNKNNGMGTPDAEHTAFFNTPTLQRKLAIGKPNDRYEQEADAVADKVVQRQATGEDKATHGHTVVPSISPLVQTKCAECAKEEELQKKDDHDEEIQRKPIFESGAMADDDPLQRKCSHCGNEEKTVQRQSSDGDTTPAPSLESRLSASKNSGAPLPAEKRQAMEGSFGKDFSNVRIHNDSGAAEMSKDLGAHAFAYGNDIYFDSGKYNPDSKEGDHLLAHELTHVVQQGGAGVQRKTDTQEEPETVNETSSQQIQGGWPEDYEFDFSWEGVKTAGGLAGGAVKDAAVWVKDQAVAVGEFIIEQITDAVDEGLAFLAEKFKELETLASSIFNTIKDGVNKVMTMITNPLQFLIKAITAMSSGLIRSAFNSLKTGVNFVRIAINGVIDSALSIANGLWGVIDKGISGIFSVVRGILNSRAFGILPGFIKNNGRAIFKKLEDAWLRVSNFFNGLIRDLNKFVNNLRESVNKFIDRVVGFFIDGVIKAIDTIREVSEFIARVMNDPESIIAPFINGIVNKVMSEGPGKAQEVGAEKISAASAKAPAPASKPGVIQRKGNGKTKRSTASLSEVQAGFIEAFKEHWGQMKGHVTEMLWASLKAMFYPPATWEAIKTEFVDLWEKDWAHAVDSLYMPQSPLDSFTGFFHDVWSNFLIILSFPQAFIRRINNVLMLLTGYVTILLILGLAVVGGIFAGPPGIIAGAALGLELSAALGEALFLIFLANETGIINIGLLELFTGRQTDEQKKHDYMQITASAIGIAIGLLMFAAFFILGKFISGIVSFLKGRKAPTPKVEAPKVEPPKAEQPKIEPPKAEGPKAEPPKTETPKADTPEAPKTETPEPPKAEPPKAETSKAETPEAPKTETPEPPKAEPPKAETPEPPKGETPGADKPEPKPGEEPKPAEQPEPNKPKDTPEPVPEGGYKAKSSSGHEVSIAEDGSIIRCSPRCAKLIDRYKFELGKHKNLADRLKKVQAIEDFQARAKAAADLEGDLFKVRETGEISHKVWNDPNLKFTEMLADYRAEFPDTSLSRKQLKQYFDEGYRLNHESGRFKHRLSEKELIPDFKANETPLDTLDTSKLKSAEAKKLKAAEQERAKLIEKRDKFPKDSQKYKDANQEVIRASERLGEHASDLYMKQKYNAEPVYTGKGNRTLDKIYKTPDGKYYVVEAKGGGSDLGTKFGAGEYKGKVLEQGSPEYLRQTINEMRQKAVAQGDDKLVKQLNKLQNAINDGEVSYLKIAQRIASDQSLKPIEVSEFKMP